MEREVDTVSRGASAEYAGRSWSSGPSGPSLPVQTVGEMLVAAAGDAADETAYVFVDGRARATMSFAQLADRAQRVAKWLLTEVEPGEAVALWSPNSADVVIAQFAVAMAGCTLVPMNPGLRSNEVAHVLRVSGARLSLVARQHRGAELPSVVRSADPGVKVVELDGAGKSLLEMAEGVDGSIRLPDVEPDSLAQIQFTSGTTGPSKGVRITHRAMVLTGMVFAERLGLHARSVILNPMPLFHTAGNVLGVMGTLAARATHTVMEFEPTATLRAISEERTSVVSLAPTLLHMVRTAPGFASADLSSVEVLFTGGMTLSPRMVEEIESAYGARLSITFGMTETCGTAIMTSPEDSDDDRRTTVGRVMAATEAMIVIDGRPVPTGQPGELMVRGPRVTTGYFGDPAATAATIGPDGWLRTGDEAVMDELGRFRITGRIKDMIKTGGENVSPGEVEDCLSSHPDVDIAAVIGSPDPTWGEIVTAYVVPVANTTIDVEALDRHSRAALAPFKVPRRWRVVEDLPRTASGKVQRAVLRQAEAAEADVD